MTLMIGDAGKLLEKHSGIHEAIVKNFNDGVSEALPLRTSLRPY